MKPLNFPQLANLSETEARCYLERLRWNGGVECPHCKSNEAYKLTPKEGSSQSLRNGIIRNESALKPMLWWSSNEA